MAPKTKLKPIDPNTQDGQILQEIITALYRKEPLSGPDGVITKLLKTAREGALAGVRCTSGRTIFRCRK